MYRPSPTVLRLFCTALCALGMLPLNLFAHKVSYVSVAASFETEPRTFSVEMAMEVDPTDDAALNAQISPEQAATAFATEVLSLYFGDTELSVTPEVKVIEPEPDEVDPNFPDRTKVIASLAGSIPEAADYFTLHLSEDNEATAIMVHFVDGDPGRRAEVLYPGEFSNPIYLRKTEKADPFTANAGKEGKADNGMQGAEAGSVHSDGDERSEKAEDKTGAASSAQADTSATSTSAATSPSRFAAGFRQVLPRNYPILVCLLALFFFNRRPQILLNQALVLAGSLFAAFALAFYQVVELGERVELLPLAALLGTALLALENLFHNRLRWWRIIVIALTGLAFGFWFDELAAELSVPLSSTGDLIVHLIGIDLALALGLAILYFAVAGVRQRSWYRKSLAFPASLIALGLALLWILLGS